MPGLLAIEIDPNWWVFIHLIGVFGFLVTHGVSIAVSLRLRKERDRDRIRQLLQFSGETIVTMYVSLGILLLGGIMASLKLPAKWWNYKWPKLSLLVTLLAIGLMSMIARPYYRGIKEACALRPSGAPRVSDEDLANRLRGWQPFAIMAIGFGSLLALLYMMVFKKPL